MRMRRTCAVAFALALSAGCGEDGLPAVAPLVSLPTVSAATAYPPVERSVAVVVTPSKGIWVDGRATPSSSDLSAALRARADAGSRDPDGSSELDVVVLADEETPFAGVLWAMQSCAQPPVDARRFHFAVRHRASGQPGVVSHVLPRTWSISPEETSAEARVVLESGAAGAPTSPESVYAEVLRRKEAAGDRLLHVEIHVAPKEAPSVRHGYAMRILDAIRRAGVEQVYFAGLPALPSDLAGAIAEIAKRPAGVPTARIGDTVLGANGPPAGPIPDGPPPSETSLSEPPAQQRSALSRPRPGGAFGNRKEANRVRAGGGKTSYDALEHALRWLAAHQSEDGGWEGATFHRWCDGKPSTEVAPDGVGRPGHDVGLTGLSLLAFLGAGYTNRGEHPFAKTVAHGLRYLKNGQGADGCFAPRRSERFMYDHAIATLAMVDAYGMTGSVIYRGPAQQGLDFIANSRNPDLAWRYDVRPGDNDTSVSSWMTLALWAARVVVENDLRSGKKASFTLDAGAPAGMKAWLDRVTTSDGRVGYDAPGSRPWRPAELASAFPSSLSESMTAAGVLSRILLGEDPSKSDLVRRGVDFCLALPPVWELGSGRIDMYYWHLGSLAMHQVGGDAWDRWNEALLRAVIDTQRTDGGFCSYKGSWDPVDPWGSAGGRVYSTAILALCLESNARYPRELATSRDR